MFNIRSLGCAAALLLASTQGCGWFDTPPQTHDQQDGVSGMRSDEGGVPDIDSGRAGSSAAGEGGAGTSSGNGGAASDNGGAGSLSGIGGGGGIAGIGGVGGISSGGIGGLGGTGGFDDAGPLGGASGDANAIVCDAGCFAEPLPAAFVGHPEPRRFAVTDESTESGDQARVWLLARDSDDSHRLLSLRLTELDANAWTDTGIDDVTSNPVGLSFVDNGMQQQRVFFTHHGRVQMLKPFGYLMEGDLDGDQRVGEEDLDGGMSGAGFYTEELPLDDDDISLGEGDLAAITFFVEDERRIAVLAPATIGGVPGGYCVFESSASGWTASCVDEPIMHAETDVEGVVVGSEAHFYFRSIANGLIRLARSPSGGYVPSDVAVPKGRPLAPSFVAMASEVEGRIQLLVITYDGEIWSARPLATQRTAQTWAQLPPLTLGVRASTRPAVIAAITGEHFAPLLTEAPELYRVTELRVIGEDGRLYHNVTTRELEARPWQSTWYQVNDIGHDQYSLAIGANTQYRAMFLGNTYHLSNSLIVTGAERATTLQESPVFLNFIFWRDRIRMQQPAGLPSLAPIAELSAAAGRDAVLVAATQRAPEPPFNVALLSSADGATTYEGAVLQSAATSEPPKSELQPTLRYGGGKFHLTTLERGLTADCDAQPNELPRIVYRAAADAASLQAAQPGNGLYSFVRSAEEYIDDPAFALTEGVGGVTGHLVFNAGGPRDLLYYRFDVREPGNATETWLSDTTHDMPDGPAVLATGFDEALYVITTDQYRSEVCQIEAEAKVQPSSCSELWFATPDSGEVYFGAPRDEVYGACAGNAAPYYACLRDDRPFSMAVDMNTIGVPTKHRLIIAYATVDGPGSSILVVSSKGGDTIGGSRDDTSDDWVYLAVVSAPLNGFPRRYFDPEVTIDSRRRVTVTYSAIDVPPHEGQEARSFVAQAELLADGSFSAFTQVEVGTWKPEDLPFDCVTRRAAYGGYRHAETVGARALHVTREGGGHNTRWLSEYTNH